MYKVKLSLKRQATFPKQVCDALGLSSGGEILLERRIEGNEEIWLLRPAKANNRDWLGCLSAYGHGKSFDMDDIRKSVIRGRKAEFINSGGHSISS